MADLQRLIEPRQVRGIQRGDDDTKKITVKAYYPTGELHGKAIGHPTEYRLADEEHDWFRAQMDSEMLAIAEIDGA
jgi:hypothetical protein